MNEIKFSQLVLLEYPYHIGFEKYMIISYHCVSYFYIALNLKRLLNIQSLSTSKTIKMFDVYMAKFFWRPIQRLLLKYELYHFSCINYIPKYLINTFTFI